MDEQEKRRRKQKHWYAGWKAANKDKIKGYQQKWRSTKLGYDNAKERARKKGLPFAVTRKYIDSLTIPERCPILGLPLAKAPGGKPTDSSPSLDRIVPELGYVEGNILVVSNRANRLRGDATPTELRLIAAFYETLTNSQFGVKVSSSSEENCNDAPGDSRIGDPSAE